MHGAWLDAEFEDGLYDSPAALSDGIDCAHADRGPVTSPARIDGEAVHVNLIWIAAVRAVTVIAAGLVTATMVVSGGAL